MMTCDTTMLHHIFTLHSLPQGERSWRQKMQKNKEKITLSLSLSLLSLFHPLPIIHTCILTHVYIRGGGEREKEVSAATHLPGEIVAALREHPELFTKLLWVLGNKDMLHGRRERVHVWAQFVLYVLFFSAVVWGDAPSCTLARPVRGVEELAAPASGMRLGTTWHEWGGTLGKSWKSVGEGNGAMRAGTRPGRAWQGEAGHGVARCSKA